MNCTSPFIDGFGNSYPCGRCMSCKIQHSSMWAIRILHELDDWDNSSFITLTYNDENLPSDKSLDKLEIRLFIKRLRKYYNKKIKYFLCGEYGENGTERPHYHFIIFGLGYDDLDVYYINGYLSSKILDIIWNKGFNVVGDVTYQSARYVAQYIDKKYNGELAKKVYGDKQVPFQLQSQGIGLSWVEKNYENYFDNNKLIRDFYLTINGVKKKIPRYYVKKMYEKSEKFKEYFQRVNNEYNKMRFHVERNNLIEKGFINKQDRDERIKKINEIKDRAIRKRIENKRK